MKYVKSCLIITMLLGVGYSNPCAGDMNGNQEINVVDASVMVNVILAEECSDHWILLFGLGNFQCYPGDVNYDGISCDVLDLVALVNCILSGQDTAPPGCQELVDNILNP